ncbi:succinate dehydrogenase cytochrome b subunit [Prauserella marina]|uniref:succinate dehydrogenase cytochrome b subunit n=1 Tax=Prauserella marina TaxID=530584 RepID=UPI001FE568CE|nr:succinate dehydrogenase cytochrome b subunit [Prauserella marina]
MTSTELAPSRPSRPPRKPRVPRTTLGRLWSSTVGKKAVLAVTGGAMLLFVVAHMLSNLKAFVSPESLDGYALWLRTLLSGALGHEGLLWIARTGLLVCVVLHGTAAVQLARRARGARGQRYRVRSKVQGSYAARTMRWGGVILVLFIAYHILDLTTGHLNPHGVSGEVYRNVVADFQLWPVTALYTLAVLALGLHIRHGVWSALHSLGAATASRQRAIRLSAIAVATAITVGYLSVPFAVQTGLLR